MKIFSISLNVISAGIVELPCSEPKARGKYVTIKKFGGTKPQQFQGLCEIEVYSKDLINQLSELGLLY